jgi:sugar diacid utilization regulator
MLDQKTAKLIYDKLLPLVGEETIIIDPIGHIVAGDSGDVSLLSEPNVVPFLIGRVTVGYVLPPRHLDDHDRLFGFIQTIAELIVAHSKPVERAEEKVVAEQISPSGEEARTLRALLDCDLSLTRASELLGVHRNTLTYRLDKIQQTSDLDGRKFADALELNLLVNGASSVKVTVLPEEMLHDDVLMTTLRAFLEADLDINVASEKLSIHRNTLTYRLDKIRRVTDLDPRRFADAASLKISL